MFTVYSLIFGRIKLTWVDPALRPFCKLWTFLERKDRATISHALVTSSLNYCNALHVGLPWETAWKLQFVQNVADHALMRASNFERITPILQELHWLPLASCAQFKVPVLIYKALNGLWLGFLKDHLLRHQPSCVLCSTGEAPLSVPLAKH